MKADTIKKILAGLKNYPKDHGLRWGYGPLSDRDLFFIELWENIDKDPEVAFAYG